MIYWYFLIGVVIALTIRIANGEKVALFLWLGSIFFWAIWAAGVLVWLFMLVTFLPVRLFPWLERKI